MSQTGIKRMFDQSLIQKIAPQMEMVRVFLFYKLCTLARCFPRLVLPERERATRHGAGAASRVVIVSCTSKQLGRPRQPVMGSEQNVVRHPSACRTHARTHARLLDLLLALHACKRRMIDICTRICLVKKEIDVNKSICRE